jgi:hypothetical protein
MSLNNHRDIIEIICFSESKNSTSVQKAKAYDLHIKILLNYIEELEKEKIDLQCKLADQSPYVKG